VKCSCLNPKRLKIRLEVLLLTELLDDDATVAFAMNAHPKTHVAESYALIFAQQLLPPRDTAARRAVGDRYRGRWSCRLATGNAPGDRRVRRR
jgi:hypothetical protein